MTVTSRLNGVEASLAVKAPVMVATTANIILSGLQAIDGVDLSSGDRVLVKDQTDASENGIWTAATSDWSRATDFNGARDAVRGTQVFVTLGSTNAFLRYALDVADPVIGISELTFVTSPYDAAAAVSAAEAEQARIDAQAAVIAAGNYDAVALGAVGDGVTDDTSNFATIEATYTDRHITLGGRSFVVTSIPSGNFYVDGSWIVGGQTVPALSTPGMIDAADGSGSITSAAGSSAATVNVESSGRSTDVLQGLMWTRNGLIGGVRTGLIASFDAHVSANIAAAIAVRDTSVLHNTSMSAAVEDCFSQAKKAVSVGSIRTEATAESYTFSAASQDTSLQGENSSAMSVVNYRSGGGYGVRFTPTITGGVITAIAVTGGVDYADSEDLVFEDILGSGTGAVATMASTAGVPQSITVTNGGTNYSDDGTRISVAGIGTFQFAASVTGVSYNNGDVTAMIGGRQGNCEEGSLRSAMVGFDGSTLGPNTNASALVGSTFSTLNAANAVVLGGSGINSDVADTVTLGGQSYKPASAQTICTGYGTGVASTADRTFEINCITGDVDAAGTISGSATFADYAYVLENLNQGEIPLGTLIAQEGGKVRPAVAGDEVIGAVSAHPLILAGDSPFAWGGRYLVGEFGERLMQDVTDPETGAVSSEPIENPDYDPGLANVPRSQRPDEWSVVGIMGQLHIRVDASVSVDGYVAAGDGLGVASQEVTGIQCMRITTPFDPAKGYGVALCFKRF